MDEFSLAEDVMGRPAPRWSWIALAACLGLSMLGCLLGPEEQEPVPPEFDDTQVNSTTQIEEPVVDPVEVPSAAGPRLVYLNREGGTYHKGAFNDASSNSSTALFPDPSQPGETAQIPPYTRNDFSWNALVSCVQERYSPYNVLFTDRDPGDLPHTEIVIGGTGDMIGVMAEAGGYAPGHEMCADVERAVGFVFADNAHYQTFSRDEILEELCVAIAHEVGHTFGLVHTLSCGDIMSYVAPCDANSRKVFLDRDVPCGTFEGAAASDADLRCGQVQNSHRRLLMNLGARR